jgi:hypothetical protein
MDTTTGDNPLSLGNEEGIRLDLWEEIRGQLEGIDVGERFCKVELTSGVVLLDARSRASEHIIGELEGREGATVSIIRTDATRDQYRTIVEEGSEAY